MPLAILDSASAFANVRGASKWPKTAEEQQARLTGLAKPEIRPSFRIGPQDRVFTMGSCFARNIEVQLIQLGFNVAARDLVFPDALQQSGDRGAAMLNKFVAHSIENEIRWATEPGAVFPKDTLWEPRRGKFIDPHLGASIPQDLALVEERRAIITRWVATIVECDVIVLTLGLAETWYDVAAGTYLNIAPPRSVRDADPDRLEFHLLDYDDILSSLQRTYALIARHTQRDFRILISVSPVAMGATFAGSDALVANCYSKSVQRAAVEAFVRSHANVDYFPSYESITLSNRNLAWEADQAHVASSAVRSNMVRMVTAYTGAEMADEAGGADGADGVNDALAAIDLSLQARDAAREGDAVRAAALHEQAVALAPADPNILIEAGSFFHLSGDYASAADLLARCKTAGGTALGVDYKLAQALYRLGRIDDARRAGEAALLREPTRPGLLTLQGKILAAAEAARTRSEGGAPANRAGDADGAAVAIANPA